MRSAITGFVMCLEKKFKFFDVLNYFLHFLHIFAYYFDNRKQTCFTFKYISTE